MKNSPIPSGNEAPKKPRFITRVAQALGMSAVETPNIPETRPPVEAFSPTHMNLMDYAGRNAVLAGMDKHTDKYLGLLNRVRDLEDTYGPYVRGISQPDANTYGFSREHPKTIFKWNKDGMSVTTSEDLLYVLDASPSGDPKESDLQDGGRRIRQEYTSSTGLNFIDVRDIAPDGTLQNIFHKLYVYMQTETLGKQTGPTES